MKETSGRHHQPQLKNWVMTHECGRRREGENMANIYEKRFVLQHCFLCTVTFSVRPKVQYLQRVVDW